jgi:hypothetical protein
MAVDVVDGDEVKVSCKPILSSNGYRADLVVSHIRRADESEEFSFLPPLLPDYGTKLQSAVF